mmetsp:Transcript_11367/g.38772  ORF Transcript_11367/g.38772 Transcript_11367/m.38772 type:complete len:339 (+) Transcript_11367:287-1303(+)
MARLERAGIWRALHHVGRQPVTAVELVGDLRHAPEAQRGGEHRGCAARVVVLGRGRRGLALAAHDAPVGDGRALGCARVSEVPEGVGGHEAAPGDVEHGQAGRAVHLEGLDRRVGDSRAAVEAHFAQARARGLRRGHGARVCHLVRAAEAEGVQLGRRPEEGLHRLIGDEAHVGEVEGLELRPAVLRGGERGEALVGHLLVVGEAEEVEPRGQTAAADEARDGLRGRALRAGEGELDERREAREAVEGGVVQAAKVQGQGREGGPARCSNRPAGRPVHCLAVRELERAQRAAHGRLRHSHHVRRGEAVAAAEGEVLDVEPAAALHGGLGARCEQVRAV